MKWRLQFISLALTMGLLMITGIHLAEKGIQRVEGISDGPAQSFQVTQREDGKMEMTVLGREYSLQDTNVLPIFQSESSTRDPTEDEYKSRHSWGNQIGHWMTSISQKALNWVTRFE